MANAPHGLQRIFERRYCHVLANFDDVALPVVLSALDVALPERSRTFPHSYHPCLPGKHNPLLAVDVVMAVALPAARLP